MGHSSDREEDAGAAVVGSSIARAQAKYGVEIFAVVVMSNHLHLIVRTPRKNLARFMGYVKARLTSMTNWLLDRAGGAWARRYDAQAILDDEAAMERVGYTVANPQSAGLVDHPEEWPSLNLIYGMSSDAIRVGKTDVLKFEHLDRTAWQRAKRPDNIEDFFEESSLVLSPLPHLSNVPRHKYKRAAHAWAQAVIALRAGGESARRTKTGEPIRTSLIDAEVAHSAPANRKTLGVRAVIDADYQRRRELKTSRRPFAFGSAVRKRIYLREMSDVSERHSHASKRFCAGERDVQFPEGTYPPPIICAA